MHNKQALLRNEWQDVWIGTYPIFLGKEFAERYDKQKRMKEEWESQKDEKGKFRKWADAPDHMRKYDMDEEPITYYLQGKCETRVAPPVLHSSLKVADIALSNVVKIIGSKDDNEWYKQIVENLNQSDLLQERGKVHLSGQLLFNLIHELSFSDYFLMNYIQHLYLLL